MAVETVEYPTDTVLEAERITLAIDNSEWRNKARCGDAYTEELAYGVSHRGPKGTTLRTEEKAAIRYFCGPCPVQETCLADAIIAGDAEDGVVGGLNPSGREKLLRHYDPDTSTVPKDVWQIAIDAALDVEDPVFPDASPKPKQNKRGEVRSSHPRVAQEEVRERIVRHLRGLPNTLLELKEQGLCDELSSATEVAPASIRRAVRWLELEGQIAKVKTGQRIAALRLVTA